MSFKEIVGQERVLAFLKEAYRNGRLAHAYLFLGADGPAKAKTALDFAKLLLCEHPEEDQPCQRCSSCLKTEKLSHPDLQWLSREGQFIKIDAIREASRRLNLKGFESVKKVLVISEADALNEESSNALLKTLEEPTPHTFIILIASNIKSILPTIASRCQKIVFSSLSEEVLSSLLTQKYAVGPEAALYLARLCEGNLGLALQYEHDRLFDRKNKIITDAMDRGYSIGEFMEEVMLQKDNSSTGIHEALCVLTSWFRDLLLAKTSRGPRNFINVDRSEEIMEICGRFSVGEIEERMLAIAEARANMRYNINTRISLAKLRAELWK